MRYFLLEMSGYLNILMLFWFALLSSELSSSGPDNSTPMSLFALTFSPQPYRTPKNAQWRGGASVESFTLGDDRARIGKGAGLTPPPKKSAYPPFLRRSLLFHPGSLDLTSESEKRLQIDAGWLREHPKTRVVVVGFCDKLGSEDCTHELAERRGTAVKQNLVKQGVDSIQIGAVKGWEKADPVCEATTASCQEMNRRARIFIVGPGRGH